MRSPRRHLASVEVVSSITEVPSAAWDVLLPQDPLTSHGWLRAVEEEIPDTVETRYVLLRRNGEIIAATPCYICQKASRWLNPDALMYGRFSRWPESLHVSFLPAMIVGPFGSNGPIRSVGGRFFYSQDLDADERHLALSRLLSATVELAKSTGLALHFPRILQSDKETLQLLARRQCHETRDFPLCYLDVQWEDFDGYLESLKSFSKKMRRNVIEERNRFRRSGITIEAIDPGAADRSRLFEIANEHSQRLNRQPLPFTPRFFDRLFDYLGDELVLYAALRSRSVVGFVMMMKRGGSAHLPLTGIDRTQTANEGTYFNLCYYRPIEDAISEGLERLYFGGTLYQLKLRRGCELMQLSHCYLAQSSIRHIALRPWFAFHSAWMDRRVTPIAELRSV